MAIVVPPCKFVHVLLQMFLANRNVRRTDAALEMRPETFERVGMNIIAHKFVQLVRDERMLVSERAQVPLVDVPLVGVNLRPRSNVLHDRRNQVHRAGRRDDLADQRTASLHDAENNGLARLIAMTAHLRARLATAYVSLVNLYRAGHRRVVRALVAAHEFAKLLPDAIRALVGHAKLALKFFAGYAVARSGHEIHGVEPQAQGSAGMLEDRPGAGVGMATLFAGVGAASGDLGQLADHPALRANVGAVPLEVDRPKASLIVRILGFELSEGVFGSHWYPLWLHSTPLSTCCQGIDAGKRLVHAAREGRRKVTTGQDKPRLISTRLRAEAERPSENPVRVKALLLEAAEALERHLLNRLEDELASSSLALTENDEPLRELCFDYRNAATAHAENYFQRIVRWVKQQEVRSSFAPAASERNQAGDDVRDCCCADPENCTQAVPGYRCRRVTLNGFARSASTTQEPWSAPCGCTDRFMCVGHVLEIRAKNTTRDTPPTTAITKKCQDCDGFGRKVESCDGCNGTGRIINDAAIPSTVARLIVQCHCVSERDKDLCIDKDRCSKIEAFNAVAGLDADTQAALLYDVCREMFHPANPDSAVQRERALEVIAAVRRYLPSAIAKQDWVWSLEQPEVSGMRWIETWDANALELGVRRFTAGDTLPPNVACWRYVEPPKSGQAVDIRQP